MSTLTEQWKNDPPAVVRLYYQLAMDALGLVMNQLIEHRYNPEAQEIIDAYLRTHHAMYDETDIASFMRQFVIADYPIRVGPNHTDCWHTLAINIPARFVEDCKTLSFDEAVLALQRLLCGENPPGAELAELVRGVLVQVQAEGKRAQDTFAKVLAYYAELKAKWIAEHEAAAHKDGPTMEGFLFVGGVPYRFANKRWRLLKALWGKGSLSIDTIANDVYDGEDQIEGRLRKIVSDTNENLLKLKLRFEITSPMPGHYILQELPPL